MKHLIQKINFAKFKEQVKALRFSVTDLIITIAVTIVVNMIWC